MAAYASHPGSLSSDCQGWGGGTKSNGYHPSGSRPILIEKWPREACYYRSGDPLRVSRTWLGVGRSGPEYLSNHQVLLQEVHLARSLLRQGYLVGPLLRQGYLVGSLLRQGNLVGSLLRQGYLVGSLIRQGNLVGSLLRQGNLVGSLLRQGDLRWGWRWGLVLASEPWPRVERLSKLWGPFGLLWDHFGVTLGSLLATNICSGRCPNI